MALTAGAVLAGKHIKEDQEEVYQDYLDEQKKAQKRGLWSSIGRTLGSYAAPLIFGTLGGPMGAIAAKILVGRLGAEAGEGLAAMGGGEGRGKLQQIKAGKHGFAGSQAKEYQESIGSALDTLDKTQWTTSIVNPFIEVGTEQALGAAKQAAGIGDKLDPVGRFKAWRTGELVGQPLSQADIMSQMQDTGLFDPSPTKMMTDWDASQFYGEPSRAGIDFDPYRYN